MCVDLRNRHRVHAALTLPQRSPHAAQRSGTPHAAPKPLCATLTLPQRCLNSPTTQLYAALTQPQCRPYATTTPPQRSTHATAPHCIAPKATAVRRDVS